MVWRGSAAEKRAKNKKCAWCVFCGWFGGVRSGSAGVGGAASEDARWPGGQEEKTPPGRAVVTQKPQFCGLTRGVTKPGCAVAQCKRRRGGWWYAAVPPCPMREVSRGTGAVSAQTWGQIWTTPWRCSVLMARRTSPYGCRSPACGEWEGFVVAVLKSSIFSNCWFVTLNVQDKRGLRITRAVVQLCLNRCTTSGTSSKRLAAPSLTVRVPPGGLSFGARAAS